MITPTAVKLVTILPSVAPVGPKVALRDGLQVEASMTVIVAMRESDDAILIGSDGEFTDTLGLRDTDTKLRRIEEEAVVWGCTGSSTVGDDFSEWLRQFKWPPPNWKVFRDDAVEKLADLNGRQRTLVAKAGAEWKDEYAAECLLTGWIGEIPEMFEFNNRGEVTSYIKQGFYAIGAGRLIASVADRILRRLQGLTPMEKFGLLMDVVVSMTPKCGPPIYIWRVKPRGVEEVATRGN